MTLKIGLRLSYEVLHLKIIVNIKISETTSNIKCIVVVPTQNESTDCQKISNMIH